VVELLRSVQDLTRPCLGCLDCWVSEEDFSRNHIRYSEQWESEEALCTHIRSDLYRRLLTAMELSNQRPEVNFYFSSESKGIEFIEATRRQPKLPEQTLARK
jgi:quinol monooxygenase YgiN